MIEAAPEYMTKKVFEYFGLYQSFQEKFMPLENNKA